MLPQGTILGNYRIEEKAGSGAFSTVYRATNRLLGTARALKVIAAPSEADFISVRQAAKLSHPNIAGVTEWFSHDGQLILVSEWADSSLEDHLRRGPLPPDQLLQLATEIAAALDHAHRHGVIHRDVKPSNVLIAGGRFLLADFGAADRLGSSGTTSAGTIAGTPLYMSPEQVTGREQSPASDVFGFGLLLYRCAYGRLPGEDSTAFEVLSSRATSQIVAPPGPLAGLIGNCLQLNAPARPVPLSPAVKAAAEALLAFEAPAMHTPPAAVPRPAMTSSVRVLGAPAPPPPDVGMGITVRAPAPKRFPWRSAAGLAAVVLLTAASTVLLLKQTGTAPPPAESPQGGGGHREAQDLRPLGISLAILSMGIGGALLFRRQASRPVLAAQRQATRILFGAEDRAALTQTLITEVDGVVAQLQSLDARVIGASVVAMVHEYQQSKASTDRQAALMNVVTLMGRLQSHLDPWHVRHKDLIATGIAVAGAAAALAQAVAGFKK